MNFIVTFFRDVLDGPVYIGLVVFNIVFICSCIGCLGERSLLKKNDVNKIK